MSGSLEYVFPYTGGSVLSLTMQEGYDSVYKRIPWVECSSQEEFDSLNENNFHDVTRQKHGIVYNKKTQKLEADQSLILPF